MQNSKVPVLIELEHYAATGMHEQELLRASLVSTALCYPIKVPVGILYQRPDRVSAVRAAGEFVKQFKVAGRVQLENGATAKLLTVGVIAAELSSAKDVSRLIQDDASGRQLRRVNMQPAPKGIQNGFVAFGRHFVDHASARTTLRNAIKVSRLILGQGSGGENAVGASKCLQHRFFAL